MSSENIKDYINSSSLGVYTKYMRVAEDTKYLVKSGRGNGKNGSVVFEPVTECICYELAKLMGIACAQYELEEKEGRLFSVSKWFYNEEEEHFYSGYKLMKILNISKENLYFKLIEQFPAVELDLNNMIVFDYIVNNTDRHLRNFGFLEKGDVLRFSPLYDNGLSLGAHIDEEELQEEDIEDLLLDSDYSKCFESSNKKQLELVKRHSLELEINFEAVVKKYSKYFSEKRIYFILYLLENRLKEVKRCFQNQ